MGWATTPRDHGMSLLGGGEHNAWEWGSGSGVHGGWKSRTLAPGSGVVPHIPPAMTKNSHQTSIYSPTFFQTLRSSCVSHLPVSIPLSLHPSVHGPTYLSAVHLSIHVSIHPSVYPCIHPWAHLSTHHPSIHFLPLLYNKLQGRDFGL